MAQVCLCSNKLSVGIATKWRSAARKIRSVTCPLCQQRKARRACPALGHQICAVCCGTKRLTEIRCPSDCVYLASAREHPPAVAVRRRQQDVGSLLGAMRDFNQRQSELFVLVCTFVSRYKPIEWESPSDQDVVDAISSLASTFETAAKGIIYEHRPPSATAERLATALKPAILEAGRSGGTAFERDATVVLRRIADVATELRTASGATTAFLDLLHRTIQREDDSTQSGAPPQEPTRLIVP
jgi:hypothetical protein